MASYATTAQYIARFGSVSDTAMLQECLDDCSAVIEVELEKRGIDPGDVSSARLMRVCRSMANRVMPSEGGDIPVGATQASFTAGPYTQQYTLGTTYGTPKMLPSELALLGIFGGRIGCGRMAGADD